MSESTILEQVRKLPSDTKFMYDQLLKLAKVEDNAKRKTRCAPWYVLLDKAYDNYCKIPENMVRNIPEFDVSTIAASNRREALVQKLIDENLIIKNRIMINVHEIYQYMIFRMDSESKDDFIKRANKLFLHKYRELKTYRQVSNSLYRQKEILDKKKELRELMATNRKQKSIDKASIDVITVKMTHAKDPQEIANLRNQIVVLMQEQYAKDEVIAKVRQQLKVLKKETSKQLKTVITNPPVMGL